ncbi:MAG: hypothetical protein K8S27_11995 [Candidatus Omnitrophica bacterium]|nr:hypothetical protein [Candidatus Omnitrophota bacterium]
MKKLTRRQFMKISATSLLGLLVLPFWRLFANKTKKISKHVKEAKYYGQADHLAG